jgi:hypothetical protein
VILCVGCDVELSGQVLKVGPSSLFKDFGQLGSRVVNIRSGFYRDYICGGYRMSQFLLLTDVIVFPVFSLSPP